MAKQKEPIEESLEKKLWKTADKLRKNIDASKLGMMIDRENLIFEDKGYNLTSWTKRSKNNWQKLELTFKQYE